MLHFQKQCRASRTQLNTQTAGGAVQSIRDGVLDNLTGLGTGELQAHFEAIITSGGRL